MRLHLGDLFSAETKEGKDNRRSSLWRDKYLTQPLPLDVGKDQEMFFCLADNKCFRCLTKAEMHLKTTKEKHKENLLALREKYPLQETHTPSPSQETPSVLLTEKEKEKLQSWMLFLWTEFKDITFSNAERKVFDKLGIKTKLEDLKEMFPDAFEEPEPEEEEEPPAEEELPPEEPPLAEEEEATPLPLPERVVEPPPPPPPMTATPVMARRQSFHPSEMQSLYTFAMRPQPQAFPNLIVNTKQMKR
jgi:hypothetical protein